MPPVTLAQVLSDDILSAGFTKLLGAADDLVLDCPDAVHLLSLFVIRAVVDGVLKPGFLTEVCFQSFWMGHTGRNRLSASHRPTQRPTQRPKPAASVKHPQ